MRLSPPFLCLPFPRSVKVKIWLYHPQKKYSWTMTQNDESEWWLTKLTSKNVSGDIIRTKKCQNYNWQTIRVFIKSFPVFTWIRDYRSDFSDDFFDGVGVGPFLNQNCAIEKSLKKSFCQKFLMKFRTSSQISNSFAKN